MALAPITTEAVLLRAVPYGEADLIVHLLGRRLGKLGAFARGARKSVKRFGGGLEPFTLLRVEVQERRGADLFDLRSASVLEPHLALRNDLGCLAHAGYASELARELLQDHEPHDALLDTLLELFEVLSAVGPRSLTLRGFELRALAAAGFAPQLAGCTSCGAGFGAGGVLGFDAELGGVVCVQCMRPAVIRLDPAALRLLRALQEHGLRSAAEAAEADLPLDAVRHALRAFLDRHVQHNLRSRAFLEEVGAPL